MNKHSLLPYLLIRLVALVLFCWMNEVHAQTFPSNVNEDSVPPYTLPDVLKKPNGKAVTTHKEWLQVQRPYIYHLYEQYQFGRYPTKKVPIHYRVIETDAHALQGLATRKQV